MSISKTTAEHYNAQARKRREDEAVLDKLFQAEMQRMIFGPSFHPLSPAPLPPAPDAAAGSFCEETAS